MLNKIQLPTLSAVMLIAVALSGCGGGGDSLTSLAETQPFDGIEAFERLAANSPAFGSITQSSNGDGISTDRAETSLDADGNLTLTVRDGNGNISLQLNSREHVRHSLEGTAWMDDGDQAEAYLSDWSGNGWILAKQTGKDLIVALAYATWEDADATNYLAGGYWIRGNSDEGVKEVGAFGDAGAGSVFGYYDGRESSWQRPVAGTATYLGEAEGAAVDSQNPDRASGVWWGLLRLSVDFATNTVGGCIGCPDADPGRRERGIYTYETVGELKDDQGTHEDVYLLLEGSDNINSDGSFEGTLKIVGLSELKNIFELRTEDELAQSGKWGGLFSENGKADDTPEAVVGTLGGTAEGFGIAGVFLARRNPSPPTGSGTKFVSSINRIHRVANSQLVSDVMDFSESPPLRGQTTCSGVECASKAVSSDGRADWEFAIPDETIPEGLLGSMEALGEHRGVPLIRVTDPYEAPFEEQDYVNFGGWLVHSYFHVDADYNRTTGQLAEDVYGRSLGRATGTNPLSGGATWSGVMVGRDVSASAARGNAIRGDADLTVADFNDPQVDVAFTNIGNIDTGGSRDDMTWSRIPLTSGSFGTGSDGNSIQGTFYGPNHEEVGGVFERDQVIGAFGAKR